MFEFGSSLAAATPAVLRAFYFAGAATAGLLPRASIGRLRSTSAARQDDF